ncbi:MAG: pelota family protein [Candidatus Diapherotrites archaeon]|nr:pelota family protein [Candidatus Diapherotrites archaeon]
MRLLKVDPRRGLLELLPEDREDLWLLSLLILPGDEVEGVVSRRIKREGERGSGKLFRFRVRVSVEDVEFTGSSLRIKGRIVEGPEDLVGRGKYQTLEIREGESFKVWKKEWDRGVVKEIRRAEEESRHPPVLVISLSDEDATLATYDRRVKNLRRVRRKGDDESLRPFFGEVLKLLEESPEDIVVIGGPKVIVDEFRDFVEERGSKKRISYVVSPLSGEKGVKDIVSKRAPHVIQDERRRKVEEGIEEFLLHLAKSDGLALLNTSDVEEGNVSLLLVHEDWIKENREEAHRLMKMARDFGAEVLIVSKDHEGEGTVRKLGGVVGVKRYPSN